jgi:hypothetical protein
MKKVGKGSKKVGKVTVLVCDGTAVWYEEIAPTLEAMQKLVGGYIERVVLSKSKGRTVSLYVNEEGLFTKPLNMTLTRAFAHVVNGQLHGTGFIVAEVGDEGDLASLTAGELEAWMLMLLEAHPALASGGEA